MSDLPLTNDLCVRTGKGTLIERYRKTGVGKLVGSRLYLHRQYVGSVIKAGMLTQAEWDAQGTPSARHGHRSSTAA